MWVILMKVSEIYEDEPYTKLIGVYDDEELFEAKKEELRIKYSTQKGWYELSYYTVDVNKSVKYTDSETV